MKGLIINADDFGFTRDVNAGIVHAHREGVLTSTTLMATGDAFDDAVRLAREVPSLDVGVHLVLIQGHSLRTGLPFPVAPSQVATAVMTGRLDVYDELRAQIERVLSAGIRPTHLDSHKHTHIVPKVFRTVVRLAEEFSIPFVRLPLDATVPYGRFPCAVVSPFFRRIARRHGVALTDHFLGFTLTGSLDEARFKTALRNLCPGTTEFMCHPGFLGEELRSAPTRLKASRVRELEALTAPGLRALMDEAGVRLVTFGTAAQPG